MLKVLVEGCEPVKGSKYSAAIDLYASEDVIIAVGQTKLVGLGVCIDHELIKKQCESSFMSHEHFMESHYFQLHPRSSLRTKGLIANTGIIDMDYEDEIKIIIQGPSLGHKIKKGQRIAQILLLDHKSYLMGIKTEEERTGGFGSTLFDK